MRLHQKEKTVRMMLYCRTGLGKSHLSVAVCKKVECIIGKGTIFEVFYLLKAESINKSK